MCAASDRPSRSILINLTCANRNCNLRRGHDVRDATWNMQICGSVGLIRRDGVTPTKITPVRRCYRAMARIECPLRLNQVSESFIYRRPRRKTNLSLDRRMANRKRSTVQSWYMSNLTLALLIALAIISIMRSSSYSNTSGFIFRNNITLPGKMSAIDNAETLHH